ncbi:hypothetical protein HPP92_020220 [Vanilla planifolia]|uniref:Uncharacterized protein n=1 Tax=Vanilla planifolia TaxID=51239 RepID=A0A835Q4C1_VANPL|nr:hypothetical protein HPP92_020220 [Vanilla planifolia]
MQKEELVSKRRVVAVPLEEEYAEARSQGHLRFVRGGFRMGEADSGGVAIDLEERHSHWRIVGRRWLDRGGDDPPDEGRGVVGFELCCWAGWMRSKFSVQNL